MAPSVVLEEPVLAVDGTDDAHCSQQKLERIPSPIAVRHNGPRRPWSEKMKGYSKVAFHHLKVHTGIGLMCSVAYFDPGNWGVDLQAGAEFGFKLLFVVLLADLMAVVFQVMASKLGCVTGLDLATHCRLLLHSRAKHTKVFRYVFLWPLYILSEVAIIATELAELIGCATSLSLLFPDLPLWAGVLITSADVLFVLVLGDTSGRPNKFLELLIGCLVVAVFASLIAVVVKDSPPWGAVFDGFVPSKAIFQNGGLYTSIAIVGATVMPHGLFLGSSLATQDRVSPLPEPDNSSDTEVLPVTSHRRRSGTNHASLGDWFYTRFWLPVRYMLHVQRGQDLGPDVKLGHAGWTNNTQPFIREHLWHGIVDVVGSLLGFAVIINSVILIIAGAVFFGAPDIDPTTVGLFQAFDVIAKNIGKAMAIMFALALLFAGQSASITATLAGQIVTEGFWRWRISPILRRLITRLMGLIPSIAIAVIMGKSGINTLLVASQVVLSIVLPFVAFPLVYLTSNKEIMRVKNPEWRPRRPMIASALPSTALPSLLPTSEPPSPSAVDDEKGKEKEVEPELKTEITEAPAITDVAPSSADVPEYIDYSNGWIMMSLGYIFWFIMVVANIYVLVELALGNE